MGFNMTCSPGKDAAAAYMRVAEHQPALVVYLDPVNLAIQVPPFPGGDLLLARFCRELAREAAKFADELERERRSETSEARHRLADAPGWSTGSEAR